MLLKIVKKLEEVIKYCIHCTTWGKKEKKILELERISLSRQSEGKNGMWGRGEIQVQTVQVLPIFTNFKHFLKVLKFGLTK